MRNKITYLFLSFGILSCGSGKNTAPATEAVTENPAPEITDQPEETETGTEPETFEASRFAVGTIRDFSDKEGCSYVIEMEDSRILEPLELGEEFKKEGLEVKFSYTPQRRPSICTVPSTPVLVNSMAVN